VTGSGEKSHVRTSPPYTYSQPRNLYVFEAQARACINPIAHFSEDDTQFLYRDSFIKRTSIFLLNWYLNDI